MQTMRLAVFLLAGTGLMQAANIVVSCGNVAGTGTDNNNNTWTLAVVCADGLTFNGTATRIDTGAPSDFRIQGNFVDPAGGAFAPPAFTFGPLPGFTQPAGPMVQYWHELHGLMNLGNPAASASIAFPGGAGIDLQGAGGNCTVDDPGISTGMINGTFSIVGQAAFCNDTPLWTRGAVSLVVAFGPTVAANGSITLGAGSADSDFAGAPEPASWALGTLGLLTLAGRRYVGARVAQRRC